MKKTLVLAAGLVLALAPAGAALAGGTGNGNAHGNCQNSSAGGVHAPLPGSAGNGNGGHSKGEVCALTAPGVPTVPGTGSPGDGVPILG